MINTIGSLLSGKPVQEWYRLADEKWSDLIAKYGTGKELADALESAQMDFERICGDIDIGKEVMAITGIAHFYSQDDGFRDPRGREMAGKVYAAIRRSNCSGEVHTFADFAADLFSLERSYQQVFLSQ
jgi:hypothetical protein